MGLKSFLQKFGLFKNKETTPSVVESPVRPESKVEAQCEVPKTAITEVKAEEPTKVMVDRLVEVSEKKEEAKVTTARDIKAKSKKVQKPVENRPDQKQNQKPNPNQKPQAKRNPNQKPQAKKSNPNQKPQTKKG